MSSEFISSPIPPTNQEPKWTLLATGDFAVELSATCPLSDNEFDQLISADIQSLFTSTDVSIVNLEAPLSAGAPPIPKIGPAIRLDPRSIEILSKLKVRIATLANNHAMDFDSAGLIKTIAACQAASILTPGAGSSLTDAFKPARLSIGKVRLSIFSFCESEFGIATESSSGTAPVSHSRAIAAIEEEKSDAHVIIVAAHGGVEHSPISPIQRARQLRSFIDHGANCVIGNHPHVPQAWEFYNSGLIFHSLGNFLFRLNCGPDLRATWNLLARLHFCGRQIIGFEAIPVSASCVGQITFSRNAQEQIEYLQRLSHFLADPKCSEELWNATAIYLWKQRYRRLLAMANGSVSGRLRLFLRRLRSGQPSISSSQWRNLLWQNLFRAESHRWTIESAKAALLQPLSPDVANQIADLFGIAGLS